MSKLRQILNAFGGGSVEELAAGLQVVHLFSTHPKCCGAGPDFPDQAGSGSKHATTNSMSVRQ
jgi:hypothetical protein